MQRISKSLLYFTSIAVVLTLMAAKCEKNAPVCSQNCVTVNFRGWAYNKVTRAPITNTAIEAKWVRRGINFGTNKYRVSGGYTKQDGSFNLTAIVDTGNFRDFTLDVIPANNGTYFIMAPPYQVDHKVYWEVDPTAMQNIEFQFYPKTILTIKLRRSMRDTFTTYSIQSYFDNYNSSTFDRGSSVTAKDSVIQIPTSADIYTYLYARKTDAQYQTYFQKTDSILCRQGQANVITIDF